ncbi:hypothetical protein CLU85_1866 [Acidovorax sp. 69]|nr:hypothetical protein CLU85_1866 [Acidovorax sp. 69]
MSLIHDALKSMEAPQESKPVGARAPAVMARHRPAWLDAVLAFVVVLGAGVLGWFIWQSQMKPKTDLPPSSAVSVTSPASVPQQLVAASPPPTAEMAQSPQQPAAPQGNLAVPADVAILLPNPMAQPSPVPQQQMPSPSALDTAVPKALASVSLSDVRSAPAQTAARQSSSRQVQTSKPGGCRWLHLLWHQWWMTRRWNFALRGSYLL